jgi:hypothetical protein
MGWVAFILIFLFVMIVFIIAGIERDAIEEDRKERIREIALEKARREREAKRRLEVEEFQRQQREVNEKIRKLNNEINGGKGNETVASFTSSHTRPTPTRPRPVKLATSPVRTDRRSSSYHDDTPVTHSYYSYESTSHHSSHCHDTSSYSDSSSNDSGGGYCD